MEAELEYREMEALEGEAAEEAERAAPRVRRL